MRTNLTPREDFKNFFSVMSDETALYYEKESKRLFTGTDYCVIGNLRARALAIRVRSRRHLKSTPRASASLTSG